MVAALQVASGPSGTKTRRPFRCRIETEWIPVGRKGYQLLGVLPDRKGRIDWEGIRLAAGEDDVRFLLPVGLSVPEEYGLPLFEGRRLGQELMAIAGLYLLRKMQGTPRRLSVALYDPRGCMPGLAAALLPYAGEVRVVTRDPARFTAQEEWAMEAYGATFVVTEDKEALGGAALVLAPEGLGGFCPGGWVLSGVPETGRHVVDGYIPQVPAVWLDAVPDRIDPWLFLAALYEEGAIPEILSRPPVSLRCDGKILRTEEVLWRVAGLDIGISV